jgi:serine/threonine-protein kinase HipA
MNTVHPCLRDAAPDAWGRRIIGYQYPALAADELDYMLLSSSDRIGALDFQESSTDYRPRGLDHPALIELLEAASLIEQNQPLPPELDHALLHGTSVGGARPKALVDDGDHQYIAKFSSTTDTYTVVKGEYAAMRLAKLVGIDVAEVSLKKSLGKDVLLVKRFDRYRTNNGVCRRAMLSGLSLLRLNEMEARYASYQEFAELIRQRFANPRATLHELYRRLVFNVIIGNTDDHARNYAAFWDGKSLILSPAYDLCPQMRTGREATQAMQLGGAEGNHSTLSNVLSICASFQLDEETAREMIEEILACVKENWSTICDEAKMTRVECDRFWQRAILNPYCLQGWE